jgi:hypothetical protein
VSYFKELSRHASGETEKNHRNLRMDSFPATQNEVIVVSFSILYCIFMEGLRENAKIDILINILAVIPTCYFQSTEQRCFHHRQEF